MKIDRQLIKQHLTKQSVKELVRSAAMASRRGNQRLAKYKLAQATEEAAKWETLQNTRRTSKQRDSDRRELLAAIGDTWTRGRDLPKHTGSDLAALVAAGSVERIVREFSDYVTNKQGQFGGKVACKRRVAYYRKNQG